MKFEVKGLVLHETPIKDNDRYLDVLTEKYGRISVYARGVRSYKSKNMTSTMPMCYSNFVLDRQKDDFIVLSESDKIEMFGDIKSGLESNALCMYICDIAREFALPNEISTDLLRLTLNTLHAATHKLYPLNVIKAAFEVRVMSDGGFMPDLTECATCHNKKTDNIFLDVMNGCLICAECLHKRPQQNSLDDTTSTILSPLSITSIAAMRYIITAPLNRLFSFKLQDKQHLLELCSCAETYLLNHLEKGFSTLDFYKQVIDLTKITKDLD